MKRIVRIGLAAAAAAAFAVPSTASADPAYCDKTFLPRCQQCVDLGATFAPVCVNIGIEAGS